MIRHILLPLNMSTSAEAILPHAIEVARGANARLTLLTVVPTAEERITEAAGISAPGELLARAGGATRVAARASEAATEYLSDLRARLLAGCDDAHPLEIDTRVVAGRPGDTILRLAAEIQVDLIAMAGHGRRGLRRAPLGGCVGEVVRRFHGPVLLIAEDRS